MFWLSDIEILLLHITSPDFLLGIHHTITIGAGGVFELDLGDSEIPLTLKQEREQKLLEEQLKKKRQQSSDLLELQLRE